MANATKDKTSVHSNCLNDYKEYDIRNDCIAAQDYRNEITIVNKVEETNLLSAIFHWKLDTNLPSDDKKSRLKLDIISQVFKSVSWCSANLQIYMKAAKKKNLVGKRFLSAHFHTKNVENCEMKLNLAQLDGNQRFVGTIIANRCYKHEDWVLANILDIDGLPFTENDYIVEGKLNIKCEVTLRRCQLPTKPILPAELNVDIKPFAISQCVLGEIIGLHEIYTKKGYNPGQLTSPGRLNSGSIWHFKNSNLTHNIMGSILEGQLIESPVLKVQFLDEVFEFILYVKKVELKGSSFININVKALTKLTLETKIELRFHQCKFASVEEQIKSVEFEKKQTLCFKSAEREELNAFEGVCLLSLPLPLTGKDKEWFPISNNNFISCHFTIKLVKHEDRFKPTAVLNDYLRDATSNLVGLDFVFELSYDFFSPHYECTLCNEGGKVDTMFKHLQGLAHKIKFFQNKFPDYQRYMDCAIDESFLKEEIQQLNLQENDKLYKITTILNKKLWLEYMEGPNTLFGEELTQGAAPLLNKIDSNAVDNENLEKPKGTSKNTQERCAGCDKSVIKDVTRLKDIDPSSIDVRNDDDLKKACTAVQKLSEKIKNYRISKKYADSTETELLHAQVDAIMEGLSSGNSNCEKMVTNKRKRAPSPTIHSSFENRSAHSLFNGNMRPGEVNTYGANNFDRICNNASQYETSSNWRSYSGYNSGFQRGSAYLEQGNFFPGSPYSNLYPQRNYRRY